VGVDLLRKQRRPDNSVMRDEDGLLALGCPVLLL